MTQCFIVDHNVSAERKKRKIVTAIDICIKECYVFELSISSTWIYFCYKIKLNLNSCSTILLLNITNHFWAVESFNNSYVDMPNMPIYHAEDCMLMLIIFILG